jgi:hypothetical protein
MSGSTATLTICLKIKDQHERNLAKGSNMYKKTTTTVEEFFDAVPAAMPPLQSPRAISSKALKPVIRLDVPLMIRLLEYAKEDARSDIVLHEIVERMIEMCEYGEVLEMDDYDDLVESGSSSDSSTPPASAAP